MSWVPLPWRYIIIYFDYISIRDFMRNDEGFASVVSAAGSGYLLRHSKLFRRKMPEAKLHSLC